MYTLINAKEMNQKHPDTFHIPSHREIAFLDDGDHVKLGFQGEGGFTERMWVLITNVDGDSFTGYLDNEPAFLESISYRDRVTFKPEHIMAIL